MNYFEMFREEFYEEVKDYPYQLVNQALRLLSKTEYMNLYICYKKGSKINCDDKFSKEAMQILKNVIEANFYKKKFSSVFSNTPGAIRKEINKLQYSAQVSLLKEYTFLERGRITEPLTDLDKERNKKIIENLRDLFKARSVDVPYKKSFFGNFQSPKGIVLLAVLLLSLEDRKLLTLKYGENLCRMFKLDGTDESVIKSVKSSVIPRIKNNIVIINTFIPKNLIESISKMLTEREIEEIFSDEELMRNVKILIEGYLKRTNLTTIFPDVSEDVIKKFISKFGDDARKTFYKEYGFVPSLKLLVTPSESTLNQKNFLKLKKWISLYSKYLNFYKFFDVPKDVVLKSIKKLDSQDKVFLTSFYNSGGYISPNINMIIRDKNIKNIDRIIVLIQHMIIVEDTYKADKIFISIFDLVNTKDINIIRSACEKLSILKYMQKLFGDDLFSNLEINKVDVVSLANSDVIYNLNLAIDNVSKVNNPVPLYMYFIEYKRKDESTKDFIIRVNELIRTDTTTKVKSILFNRFYDDVKSIISYDEIDPNYNVSKLSTVTDMINSKLALQNLHYANSNGIPLEQIVHQRKGEFLVSNFYESAILETIKHELSFYDEKTITLFKRKYGENLDQIGKLGIFTTSERVKMLRVVSAIDKRIYLSGLFMRLLLEKFVVTKEFDILREEYGKTGALFMLHGKYFSKHLRVEYLLANLNVDEERRRVLNEKIEHRL